MTTQKFIQFVILQDNHEFADESWHLTDNSYRKILKGEKGKPAMNKNEKIIQ